MRVTTFTLIAPCPVCLPPAVERPNSDPTADCPICADWEPGPFGMVNIFLIQFYCIEF